MMKVGELFVRLAMDYSQYDKDETTAKHRVEGLGGSLSGILKNAFSFTVGMGFFQAIQAGFKATVGSALGFNVMVQNAQIGFKTMLGSASAAEAMLTDLADFAAKNQFELPDLLDAAKRMLAMGFAADDVLPTLKSVGDAAAGLGLGAAGVNRIILALGQMQAKGKVSGEEMRQLMEAGVPAWKILAQAMGKSVQEVTALGEKGLLPADKAIQALVAGMEARFPDMMKQMQNGWRGVTSAIKSVWQMTLGALTSGLFKSANDWLKKVRDVATGFYEAFQKGGLTYAISQAFGPQAAASIQTVASVLRGLWGVVVGVCRTIIANWSVIGPLTAWVVKAFLAFRVAMLVVNLATSAVRTFTRANLAMHGALTTGAGLLKIISDVVLYYKVLMAEAAVTTSITTVAVHGLRSALLALYTTLGPIGIALIAISAVLMAGTSLWSKYSSQVQAAAQKARMDKIAASQKAYVDSVNKAATGTNAQADALGNLGKASQDNLQSFDEVHQLMDQTADATMPGMPDTGAGAPEFPEFEMPEDLFAGTEIEAMSFGEKLKGFFAWLWDGIKGGAVSAWNGITGFLSKTWQGIVNLTRPIWEPLARFFTTLWAGIQAVAATVWTVIGPVLSGIWTGIVTAAQTVWGTLGPFFSMLWAGIKAVVLGVWSVLSTVLPPIWTGIVTVAQTVWSVLDPFFSGLWQAIKTAATVVWGLIQYVLGTSWFATVAMAQAVWSALGPFFGGLWEGIKTVATVAWSLIQYFLTAYWFRIVESAKAVWTVLGPFFSGLWEGVKAVALGVWGILSAVLPPLWRGIVAVAEVIWAVLRPFFEALWGSVKWIFENVWRPIQAFLEGVWNGIKVVAETTWGVIEQVIVDPFAAAKTTVESIADKIRSTVTAAWDAIVAGVKAVKDTLYEYIVEPFVKAKNYIEGIIAKAREWGRNLVRAFTGGVRTETPAAVQAAGDVVDGISNQMGFESPAKEGPGRTADRWAPNLMKMYAQGILANVNIVKNAAGAVAQSLASMAVVPSPAFAGVGASGLGTGRQPGASSLAAGPTPELHLHVGTLVADKQGLKQLERMLREFRVSEDQRVGQER